MSSADPIEAWHALVRRENGAALCGALAERMRERRLTFGGRLLCPFLRPFFLDPRDEQRVKHASETLWRLGERVASVAASVLAFSSGKSRTRTCSGERILRCTPVQLPCCWVVTVNSWFCSCVSISGVRVA